MSPAPLPPPCCSPPCPVVPEESLEPPVEDSELSVEEELSELPDPPESPLSEPLEVSELTTAVSSPPPKRPPKIPPPPPPTLQPVVRNVAAMVHPINPTRAVCFILLPPL